MYIVLRIVVHSSMTEHLPDTFLQYRELLFPFQEEIMVSVPHHGITHHRSPAIESDGITILETMIFHGGNKFVLSGTTLEREFSIQPLYTIIDPMHFTQGRTWPRITSNPVIIGTLVCGEGGGDGGSTRDALGNSIKNGTFQMNHALNEQPGSWG